MKQKRDTKKICEIFYIKYNIVSNAEIQANNYLKIYWEIEIRMYGVIQ